MPSRLHGAVLFLSEGSFPGVNIPAECHLFTHLAQNQYAEMPLLTKMGEKPIRQSTCFSRKIEDRTEEIQKRDSSRTAIMRLVFICCIYIANSVKYLSQDHSSASHCVRVERAIREIIGRDNIEKRPSSKVFKSLLVT